MNIHTGSSVPTRRHVMQGLAALATASFLPGCSSSKSTAATLAASPSNPQPTPAGAITQASLTVAEQQIGSIGPAFAGLSYEKGSLNQQFHFFRGSNTDLIGLFKLLGNSVFRIGGNSVDQNIWAPNGSGGTTGQIAPSDVDSLAAFLEATGWKCLYGINLGGSATGATTPELAAAEVAYVAQKLGPSLLGIEIGNEPDAYGNAGGYYAGNWSLSRFLTVWGEYRAAILKTTPGILITGPADSGNISGWTIPFSQAVTAREISLITQHYYRANGQSASSTAEFLITPDHNLIGDLSQLQTGAQQIGIPYRMAECNSFYGGGAIGVSDSYASALWAVDFLFDCATGAASGVNFHGGGDGNGYTPIANQAGSVVGARPDFYGILLFTLAGEGALCEVGLSAGSLNVTAYAVRAASGGFNIVVVNKGSTQNLQLQLSVPQSITSAALIELTQSTSGSGEPDLTATTGITIQGATVGLDGAFSPSPGYTLDTNGNQFSCYVSALSAVLIQVK